MKFALLSAAFGAALAVFTSPAAAQATRTWVSGVGDDVNPCSRTAPCKTFAGAISKTAAGGEISVLDPAGFGAVTITKSISIVAAGAEGSILGASVNGIVVNTGPNDAVYLKGLMLEGAGTGLNGIRLVGGGSIVIDDCVIRGFEGGTGIGIDIQPASNARVYLTDTLVTKNKAGIAVNPNPAPLPPGATRPTVSVFLDRARIVQNAGAGVSVNTGSLRLSNSSVFGNGSGLAANGGEIVSFGNNAIAGNGGQDGAPTSKVSLQ